MQPRSPYVNYLFSFFTSNTKHPSLSQSEIFNLTKQGKFEELY